MDLITQLQEIGLTGREAEIYINLLQKKDFRAPEIAKITSISRTKIYEILQNLINKGACSERQENGKKIYSAIEPDIAINNILSVQRKQLMRREKIAEIIEKKLTEFHKHNNNNTGSLDYIEIIKNKDQVRKKFLDLLVNAKNEILCLTKPPYASSDEDIEPIENKKGRKVYTVWEYGAPMTKEEQERFMYGITCDEEVRIIKELPMKLVIFDQRITLLTLNDPVSLEPSLTTVVVTHPSFAQSLRYVFESIWEKAIPYKEFFKNNTLAK